MNCNSLKKLMLVFCIIIFSVANVSTLPVSAAPLKDKASPVIKSSIPAQGAKSVSIGGVITIRFSENIMKDIDFNRITLNDKKNNSIDFSISIKDDILKIKPKAKLLSYTDYTLTVPSKSVKDLSGNSLAKPFVLIFSTIKTTAKPNPTPTQTSKQTPAPIHNDNLSYDGVWRNSQFASPTMTIENGIITGFGYAYPPIFSSSELRSRGNQTFTFGAVRQDVKIIDKHFTIKINFNIGKVTIMYTYNGEFTSDSSTLLTCKGEQLTNEDLTSDSSILLLDKGEQFTMVKEKSNATPATTPTPTPTPSHSPDTGSNDVLTLSQASDFNYTILEDGTVAITGFLNYPSMNVSSIISIPSKIDGKSVTTLNENAFATVFYGSNKVKIILPNTMTKICDNAIWDIGAAKIIMYIPSSVISIGKNNEFTTVYGDINSTAEDYCKKNNIEFITGKIP